MTEDAMKDLLTDAELAKMLRVSRTFLWELRQAGLPYLQLGNRMIRYIPETVAKWLSKNEIK
jgi:hypothetical protein